ncbi:MAG: hypothetical protein AB7P22_15885 [Vicinamibacterales bacterium]
MSNNNAARDYVKSLDLSGTPRGILAQDAATEATEVFIGARNQALVVGSGLFSFARGVTPEIREAISDSALLAQLVANKRQAMDASPMEWYGEYLGVLQNIGWVIQGGGWNDYSTKGSAVEVHQKIIEVLTVALGPSVAATAIVKSALDALQAMAPDSSWLTIFSRESQKAKMARFQIGLVEANEEADVFVSMLACLIEAKSSITQVLFFKFREEQATFKANSAKASINKPAITDLGPTIRTKVRAYQADYLSSIKDI